MAWANHHNPLFPTSQVRFHQLITSGYRFQYTRTYLENAEALIAAGVSGGGVHACHKYYYYSGSTSLYARNCDCSSEAEEEKQKANALAMAANIDSKTYIDAPANPYVPRVHRKNTPLIMLALIHLILLVGRRRRLAPALLVFWRHSGPLA